MNAELLMIGSELLLGQIHDTNSTYMSQLLAEHGIGCYQKTTVGDNRQRIIAALDAGLDRSDVILCSGGLGPTEDDITRECIAELLGLPMEYREELFEAIAARFANLRRKITENNKKQATLPKGALAIENPNGTAPGVIVESERGVIVCMPGVPHELKPMLENQVLPYLKEKFAIAGTVRSHVLKVCGMGESAIDDRIGDLMNAATNPTIGLLASPEFVRIRITAKANDVAHADALIAPVAEQIHARLPGKIMGEEDDTLEDKVAGLLKQQGMALHIVETTTGGMIAQRLLHADPDVIVEGRILPTDRVPTEGPAALDLTRRQLLGSTVSCVLVCCPPSIDGAATVVLDTPQGCHTWEKATLGGGLRAQVRLTVTILEQLRQFLSTEQETLR